MTPVVRDPAEIRDSAAKSPGDPGRMLYNAAKTALPIIAPLAIFK
jgi:hypothetical protein